MSSKLNWFTGENVDYNKKIKAEDTSIYQICTNESNQNSKNQTLYHDVKNEMFNQLYHKYNFPKELIKIVEEYYCFKILYDLVSTLNYHYESNSLSISLTKTKTYRNLCLYCDRRKTNKNMIDPSILISHIPAIYEKYKELIGQDVYYQGTHRSHMIRISTFDRISFYEDIHFYIRIWAPDPPNCFNINLLQHQYQNEYWTLNKDDKTKSYKPFIFLTESNLHTTLSQDYEDYFVHKS